MSRYKLVEVTPEEYVALGLAGAWVYAAHNKPTIVDLSTAQSDAEMYPGFAKFASNEYSFGAFYTRTLEGE